MNVYAALADTVLLLHFSFVLFVVAGLLSIIVGHCRRWNWIRNGWFRLSHLAAIIIVAAQAWLGKACPLTLLEAWLRAQAGQPGYEESFIQHWLDRLLYYNAPLWVFTLVYTLFALLVLAAWFAVPPRLPWRNAAGSQERSSTH